VRYTQEAAQAGLVDDLRMPPYAIQLMTSMKQQLNLSKVQVNFHELRMKALKDPVHFSRDVNRNKSLAFGEQSVLELGKKPFGYDKIALIRPFSGHGTPLNIQVPQKSRELNRHACQHFLMQMKKYREIVLTQIS